MRGLRAHTKPDFCCSNNHRIRFVAYPESCRRSDFGPGDWNPLNAADCTSTNSLNLKIRNEFTPSPNSF